ATARKPVADLREQTLITAPVAADRVAVLTVPLSPEHREVPHLVAVFTQVPWLGDQLHARDNRILVDSVEEPRQLVHCVQLARQRRSQVEAEAIDVHLLHPVAQ